MEKRVTLVVVPRERFSFAARSLASLYGATREPFDLVYVDGGSPPAMRDHLAREAQAKGFRLLRTERFLAPNEARNLGAREVRTPYAVFLDNDVLVEPGWLGALVRCAEETGAWIVGPIYCAGDPRVVHMAGGEARILEDGARRRFHERHSCENEPLEEVRRRLRRAPCELVEFHCLLLRMEAYRRLGPFDEGLKSALEHADLCLAAREAGGGVWLEPESAVTYVPPPPFRRGDLPFFLTRWSDPWNEESVRRFAERWRLPADDPTLVAIGGWLRYHRKLALPRATRILAKGLGRRGWTRVTDWMDERLRERHGVG